MRPPSLDFVVDRATWSEMLVTAMTQPPSARERCLVRDGRALKKVDRVI